MPLSPLGSIHGWMVSGMAFHHRPWKTYMIRLRGAWHAILVIGKHTRSDNVQCPMTSSPFRSTQSDDISCGIQSSPLGSTHGSTTSSVACHYQPLRAYIIGRRRAWHDIIALGMNTQSDDVGRGMLSSPLYRTHDSTTSGVACAQAHTNTHGLMMSGESFHHRPWVAQMVS